ncbi:MAG: hypothetical protein GX969_00050 [Firmicutes bacterium]|nr:hypothetical protein [Bacillota bacterium]
MDEILNTLADATLKFMPMENVVGVGRGYKVTSGIRSPSECIVVMVKEKLDEIRLKIKDRVPNEYRGVPTDVIEVGELRFLNRRQSYMRPARPGISCGHYKSTAGTFGATVWDTETREPFILSNNHVLANATSGRDGRAQLGDPIVQPGIADGGTVEQHGIAVLERFIPIKTDEEIPPCFVTKSIEAIMNKWLSTSKSKVRVEIITKQLRDTLNLVDAAIARPLNPDLISTDILGLGEIKGVREPDLRLRVKKSGRTTGVTEGEIQIIDATVSVVYSGGTTVVFTDQVLTGKMAEGGDSGALLVDEDMNGVGLLFAGSAKVTIYNRITTVMEMLNVSLERE